MQSIITNSMERRNHILFSLAFFFLFARLGVFFPGFILYLKHIGFSMSEIGIMNASAGLVMIFSNQIWGYLSDLVLGRRRIIIISLISGTILFLFLAPMRSFPSMLILYFFSSLFNAHLIQSMVGFVMAMPGGKNAFFTTRAWGSLGFVIGVVTFGWIADRFGPASIFAAFAFISIIYLMSVYLLLNDQTGASRKEFRFIDVQKFFLTNPKIVIFFFMAMLYYTGHSFPNQMVSVVLENLGASKKLVGLAYAMAALPEVPLFFLTERLIRRWGVFRLMAFCCGVCVLRWGVVAFVPYLWPNVLIMPTSAVTFGLFYLCSVRYMDNQTPASLKSSAQTLLGISTFGLAIIISHWGGGWLADWVGELRHIYPVAMAIAVGTLGILGVLRYLEAKSPSIQE